MKSNSKTKVASLVTAALLALIALFGMTACPNNAGGNTDSASGGNTGGLELPQAPLVQGGASLILSPDKLTIKVKATTSDNSPITVEGCDKTELASGTQTELKAKGTKVVLKGKITNLFCGGNKLTALNVQGLNALKYLDCTRNKLTALNVQGLNALKNLDCYSNRLTELNVQGLNALKYLSCGGNKLTALNVQGLNALQSLHCGSNKLTALNVQGLNALQGLYCEGNQLTALNVQGCTSLQYLYCHKNQLTADAFIKLFNDLPQRTANEGAQCNLYTEQSGVIEGNHKDFTSPGELKTAFDNAKTVKKWKMYKYDRDWVEI